MRHWITSHDVLHCLVCLFLLKNHITMTCWYWFIDNPFLSFFVITNIELYKCNYQYNYCLLKSTHAKTSICHWILVELLVYYDILLSINVNWHVSSVAGWTPFSYVCMCVSGRNWCEDICSSTMYHEAGKIYTRSTLLCGKVFSLTVLLSQISKSINI